MIGRVRHRTTFADLRRRGARSASGPVTVTYLGDPAPTGPPPMPCVAFAIPRRVGGAVVRNRVRRRLRAILAERARRAGPAGGAHLPAGAYLVAVRPGVAELSHQALGEHLDRALARLAGRRAAIPTGAAGPGRVGSP